jgi:hypothetical protein
MSAQRVVIELKPDCLLPLRELNGARIACLEGVLWITHDSDPHDILLEPGQVYELTRKGATVQALGASRMAIEAAPIGIPLRGRLAWGRSPAFPG